MTTTEPSTTPPTEPAGPNVLPAEPAGTEPTTTEPDEQPKGPAAEAARYRRQLRDTEGERDGLRTRVETFQRRDAERVAAEHLADPGDLFTVGGVQLADLLDEDGEVDHERVTEAARAVIATRPGLGAKAIPRPYPSQGARWDGAPSSTGWGSVLRTR